MNVRLRRARHDGRPTVVRFRAMLKEDGTRQEIIAQQAVTMRQLTAASSQEASEDAEMVEEAPDRARAAPLRCGRVAGARMAPAAA
jgi:hypothetical protein